ncbi:MAG: dihydrofolate reductase family protein [Terriglobales bacterium]
MTDKSATAALLGQVKQNQIGLERNLSMRKLNVLEFVSLDGVIEAPGEREEDASEGPPWWIRPYRDPVSGAAVQKQMNMPFDLLLGRKTFELWAQYWPQHNDIWPGVNSATKYVASNTMTSHAWQPSVFLSGDIAEKIAKIKQQEGPDLHVWGSANLVQTLLKHDLVDAFWLTILPITLGGDKRLFAEGTITAAFKLTESTVTSKGVIIVTYERVGAVPTGSL